MLVADDSYTVRRYLQQTFQRKEYVVDVAQNGWQAFAQMQTRLYDFVFLDIEMPVMNGYQAQAIRRWEARVEREQKQFICALTSHAQPDERELGLGIGPLWKPKSYGAFVLNHRRPPRHDATPARRRGGDFTARPSQDGRVVAGAPDALVDFHTGIGMDLFEAKPAKPSGCWASSSRRSPRQRRRGRGAAIAAAATAKAWRGRRRGARGRGARRRSAT